jgi:hypothetical protein
VQPPSDKVALDIETHSGDEPVLWDGDYEKVFYRVHLPSGEFVQCYPNAGWMNATDGSGRMWKPQDAVLVSVDDNHHFRSEEFHDVRSRAVHMLEQRRKEAAESGDPQYYEKLWKALPPPAGWPRDPRTVALRPTALRDLRRDETKRLKRERYLRRKKRK